MNPTPHSTEKKKEIHCWKHDEYVDACLLCQKADEHDVISCRRGHCLEECMCKCHRTTQTANSNENSSKLAASPNTEVEKIVAEFEKLPTFVKIIGTAATGPVIHVYVRVSPGWLRAQLHTITTNIEKRRDAGILAVLDTHIAEAEQSYKSAVNDQSAPYRHQLERLLEIRAALQALSPKE